MKKQLILLVLGVWAATVAAQVEPTTSNRVWYSAYVFKKINHRWSIDNYSLIATRNFQQQFWLAQNNIGINYRLNRFYTLSLGYGHALYKYTGAWWDRHYPDSKVSRLNTVGFHSLSAHVRRQHNVGTKLRWSNKVSGVFFIPKFEKYQLRLHFATKLTYRKRDLPLHARPFVQGTVYYYLNGVEAVYYDELEEGQFVVTDTLAPNGLHRFRLRAGVNVRPLKDLRALSFTLYMGYNREFNGSGNELNFLRPSSSGKRTFVTYPFNNYLMYGVQMNVFL